MKLAGRLTMEEIRRWEELLVTFNREYGNVFPIRATVSRLIPKPPVGVLAIVGGPVPYIVTQLGESTESGWGRKRAYPGFRKRWRGCIRRPTTRANCEVSMKSMTRMLDLEEKLYADKDGRSQEPGCSASCWPCNFDCRMRLRKLNDRSIDQELQGALQAVNSVDTRNTYAKSALT